MIQSGLSPSPFHHLTNGSDAFSKGLPAPAGVEARVAVDDVHVMAGAQFVEAIEMALGIRPVNRIVMCRLVMG